MDFIKYFSDKEYIKNKNDCWAFVRQVFMDEHNFCLPEYPIMGDNKNIASFLIENISYKIVQKAEKGCIVYYKHDTIHHAGYALNDKEFIHKSLSGVTVSKIPKNSIIYKVLND